MSYQQQILQDRRNYRLNTSECRCQNPKANISSLNLEVFRKEGNWDFVAVFPVVDVDRITGCLGAAWERGEKGQCHRVSGMNIW